MGIFLNTCEGCISTTGIQCLNHFLINYAKCNHNHTKSAFFLCQGFTFIVIKCAYVLSKCFLQNQLSRNLCFVFLLLFSSYCVPVAQWLEHCVSSAEVVGLIPRKHMYWQYKCIVWMHCKSLWIKASAKCNIRTSKIVNRKSFWLFLISRAAELILQL